MHEARNWTFRKRLSKEPSIQRQKHCYSHLQVSVKLTSSVFKDTGLQKKRRRIAKKISLPTPPLLTYLVGNSYLPFTKPPPPTQRRTKIKVFNVDNNKNRAATLLPRVLMPVPLKKKWKISPKSSATIVTKKGSTLISVLNQKTSVNFSNFYTGDWD